MAETLDDRWTSKLTGRTTDSDDGRVFELTEKARGDPSRSSHTLT